MPSDTSPDSPAVSVDAPADSGTDSVVVHRFEFRGTTGEFFRIWIVNTLLTIVTLGLFSPWAKVRTRRYFHASAFLDGANFDYRANPWSILLARLLVVAVVVGGAYYVAEDPLQNAVYSTLITLFLPWALVRGMAFNARCSTHRGARFAFKKQTAVAYLIFAPIILMSVAVNIAFFAYETSAPRNPDDLLFFAGAVALAALFFYFAALPWFSRAWQQFTADNHSLGGVRFHFKKPPIRPYLAACWAVPICVFTPLAIFFFKKNLSLPALGLIMIAVAFLTLLLALPLVRAHLLAVFLDNLRFSAGNERGKFAANFSPLEFAVKIEMVNLFAKILSLGLLHPWAKIRRARFLAARLAVEAAPAAFEKIPATRGTSERALGEEFGESQEFGFGLDGGLV